MPNAYYMDPFSAVSPEYTLAHRDTTAIKRQKDLEYFDRYGYFPEQAAANKAAGQAGQAEYEQLIREIEGQLSNIGGDPMAQALQKQFMGTMGGGDVPYDAQTINDLVSQGTDPIMRGASTGLSQLRESFAARGLGRSGGLGSLEQQIMQEAIARASSTGADIRGQYVGQNFAAREQARQGAAGLYGQQQGFRGDLVSLLANLRAQKQFDPNQFPGGRFDAGGAGGYIPAGTGYVPPASIQRRRVGQSVPRYNATQFDPTGSWAASSWGGGR